MTRKNKDGNKCFLIFYHPGVWKGLYKFEFHIDLFIDKMKYE